MPHTQTHSVRTHRHMHNSVVSDKPDWSTRKGTMLHHWHSYSVCVCVCVCVDFEKEQSRPQCWLSMLHMCVCVYVGVCVCPTSGRRQLIMKKGINYCELARMNWIKTTKSRRGHRVNVYWANDECLPLPFSLLSSAGPMPRWLIPGPQREREREREKKQWEWHNVDNLPRKTRPHTHTHTQIWIHRNPKLWVMSYSR